MGSVVSAARWGLMLPCGLAGGWVLPPALSSSSPSSEAGAAESARTSAAPMMLLRAACARASRACECACVCLHFAGRFGTRRGG